MYSLHVNCAADESEFVSAELWEAGTVAVCEMDFDGRVVLIAGFETNGSRQQLLEQFARYAPEWRSEPARDWVAETEAAWPPRAVGERLFLAPLWSDDATPPGRLRIVHNPGLACGTGEHPCTQLALMALERCVTPGLRVVDVGTGSGLLAIAAVRLGARTALGIDPDEAALSSACENFALNCFAARLAVGSADCLATSCADVTVANISGTVLLAILDDLLRITRPGGWIVLTGFPQSEASVFEDALPISETFGIDDWRCVVARNV